MDHDHKEMVLRGLLCVRCNRNVPDWVTPEWLRSAANYLEASPYQHLLGNVCHCDTIPCSHIG